MEVLSLQSENSRCGYYWGQLLKLTAKSVTLTLNCQTTRTVLRILKRWGSSSDLKLRNIIQNPFARYEFRCLHLSDGANHLFLHSQCPAFVDVDSQTVVSQEGSRKHVWHILYWMLSSLQLLGSIRTDVGAAPGIGVENCIAVLETIVYLAAFIRCTHQKTRLYQIPLCFVFAQESRGNN